MSCLVGQSILSLNLKILSDLAAFVALGDKCLWMEI